VIGGKNAALNPVQTCSVFDMLKNRWETLTCMLPDVYVLYITVQVVKKRLIYGFGGYGS
jgi:hypothetical protein